MYELNCMNEIEKISTNLVHHVAGMAQDFGFLDEISYRNLCIKLEFKDLRKKEVTVEKAEILLSEKWTNKSCKLSPETIHGIIYKR